MRCRNFTCKLQWEDPQRITAFSTKRKSKIRRGLESESLQAKGKGVKGLKKLNCKSKAQTKPKLNMKDIRKCLHPMHGVVSWTKGTTQPASGRSGDSSRFGRLHSRMTLVHTLYSSLLEDFPDFLSWNCNLTFWYWLSLWYSQEQCH